MKKSGKILALLLMGGLCTLTLAGCSSWSGIENSKSDQILYNGGIVSVVDDNLFYANGYTNTDITTMDEFNAAAQYSYLARLNLAEAETSAYTSPDAVNKLNSEVVGYSNMYSFVLGDFVYYASPNKHRTSSNTYVFTYVSIFKTRLNGSDTTELMTTSSYNSETAQLRAVSVDGQNFLLVYDGTTLSAINLANDSVRTISSAATSVALPREGESFNGKLYYTEDKANTYGESGNEVFECDLLTGESKAIMKTINNTITFDNYNYVFTHGMKAIKDTLIIACIGTPLGGLLAVLVGYVTTRLKIRGHKTLETTSLLNYTLPGTVVGIAYIIAFNDKPIVLTGTLWILIAAYLFRYSSAGIRNVIAALTQIDPSIEEASRSLGAGSARTFVSITIPLVLPAILSGMKYLFIHSMTAISATIFLVSVNWTLITTRILECMTELQFAQACAFSIILILLVFAASGAMTLLAKTLCRTGDNFGA